MRRRAPQLSGGRFRRSGAPPVAGGGWLRDCDAGSRFSACRRRAAGLWQRRRCRLRGSNFRPRRSPARSSRRRHLRRPKSPPLARRPIRPPAGEGSASPTFLPSPPAHSGFSAVMDVAETERRPALLHRRRAASFVPRAAMKSCRARRFCSGLVWAL